MMIFRCIVIVLFSISAISAQVEMLPCQDENDGVIGLDRKDWNGGSTASHSEGTLHNYVLPLNTFGPCKFISEVEVQITIFNVDISNLPGDCAPPGAYYVNIYTGCPSTAPASCDPSTTLLYENPNIPTINSQTLTFNSPPEDFPFGEDFSVDIVPVMNVGCTNGQSAISSGGIILDFEICITVTVSDLTIDTPPDLGAPVSVCPGSTATLDPGAYISYQWSPTGETTPTIDVGSGIYEVTVTDAAGCTGTDDIVVSSFPLPTVSFDPIAPTVCDNGSVSVSVNESYASYAWSNSMSTQTVSLTSGSYDVTVTDNNNCTAVGSITVSSVSPPNAGIDNFITVCNDAVSTYNVQAALGAFDGGGTWSDDNLSGVNINTSPTAVSFNGVTAGTYMYTYTVPGTAPCSADDAVITVQVLQRHFAGVDASEQFCVDPGPLDFDFLLGNPDAGGIWISSSGADLSNPFAVNLDGFPSGIYTFDYEIADNGVCAGAIATLTIEILNAVTAGDGNAATVCEGTIYDLMQLLSTDANTPGLYIDSDLSGALTGSMVNTAGLAGQSFDFTYEVGSAGSTCGNDQAILTLNIESSVSAGQGDTDTICAGDILDLFDFVVNEDGGGSFSALTDGTGLNSNILTTNNLIAGTYDYQYLVGDGIACDRDSTTIRLTLIGRPTITFSSNNLMICEAQCEDITVTLTGEAPFTFPISVYTPDGATLLTTDTVTTSANSYLIYTCNIGQMATLVNDSLLLENEEEYILTIPSLTDSLCSVIFGTASDTVTIVTNSATVSQIDTTACISDTLMINGHLLFDGDGMATDTFAGARCDSIVMINVTFQDSDTIFLTRTVCDGDSVLIGGIYYNQSMSNDEITTINPNGCDSVTVIDVSFFPPADSLLTLSLCDGDSLVINGNTYTSNFNGSAVFVGGSSNGCDSTVVVDLTFSNGISLLINPTICSDETIVVAGEVYNLTNPTGLDTMTGLDCDTIVTIDLSFYTIVEGEATGTFCTDYSIEVNGTTYDFGNRVGSEILLDASVNGCDSIVNINLDFEMPVVVPFSMDLCEGDSIVINGTTYNTAVLAVPETFTGVTAAGCDSTVEVTIVILPSYNTAMTEILCIGDSIFLEGAWQFSDGTFDDVLASTDLCDSIISTTVTFVSCATNVVISQENNACAGDSVGMISVAISTDINLPLSLTVTEVATGEVNITEISIPQIIVEVNNLLSGTYIITLTDSDGTLINSQTITITDEGLPMSGQWNVLTPILCSDDLGEIQYIAMGGTAGYTYDWSADNLDGSAIASDLTAGTYTLTITDQNGCEISDMYIVESPAPISFLSTILDPSCAEATDGEITVSEIEGGTGPYVITINDAMVSNGNLTDLAAGIYEITVLDANNCVSPATEILTAISDISLATYQEEYTIELGDSIEMGGLDLAPNLRFTWSDSTSLSCADCSNPTATPTVTTTYLLLVENEEGCSQSFSITVFVVERERELIFPNIFSPNGDFVNDVLIFEVGTDRPLQLSIYDRWGSLVHQSQSLTGSISWDGRRNNTLMGNGVYVYNIQTIDEAGSSINMIGDVLLSR